jgi:hypothetical protein
VDPCFLTNLTDRELKLGGTLFDPGDDVLLVHLDHLAGMLRRANTFFAILHNATA